MPKETREITQEKRIVALEEADPQEALNFLPGWGVFPCGSFARMVGFITEQQFRKRSKSKKGKGYEIIKVTDGEPDAAIIVDLQSKRVFFFYDVLAPRITAYGVRDVEFDYPQNQLTFIAPYFDRRDFYRISQGGQDHFEGREGVGVLRRATVEN